MTVTWWTHKIRNLHVNDFVMAAKTDAAFGGGEMKKMDAGRANTLRNGAEVPA